MPDLNRTSISASQASALLDASPYMTRFMLYRWLKYGEETAGLGDNRMDWGQRMEGLCLLAAAEDLRLEVRPTRAADGIQPYVKNGLLGCTRDAEIICPDRGTGALETKCVFDNGVWYEQWDGGKKIPRHIEIQLQTQMLVGDGTTPYRWGVVSAWHCAEQFYFERKPIPELWDLLRFEAQKMFDDLENDREPDPFGAPIERELLDVAFPTVIGETLDLSTPSGADEARVMGIAEQVRMMAWHAQERLGHQKAEKDIQAKLFGIAGSADLVKLPHGINYKIKEINRAGYTVKPSSYRTLTPYVPDNIADTIIADMGKVELGI